MIPFHAAAADLKAPPLRGVATAQAVQSCPEYGPGFIRLPSADVCLKTTIDITAEMKLDLAHSDLYIETTTINENPVALYEKRRLTRDMDRSTSRIDGRLNVMTVGNLGGEPVLTYTSIRSSQNTTAATARSDHGTPANSDAYLDQAWIKYAGFTAGRHASFFDFSPGFNYTGGYASQRNLNLFAYTKSFGKLGSLSLSAEDQAERRVQDGVWAAYSGQRLPDVVGQARYTPSWGVVHIGAALHEINDSIAARSTFGYAANAGIEYRQKWADLFGPAAADTHGRILLSGAYTKGALDYLGIPKFGTDYVTDIGGRIEKTGGYSTMVSYEHVWKPNFKTTLGVSSYAIEANMANYRHKMRGLVGQAGAEYMPVPGLMVGVEGDYFRDSIKGTYYGVDATRDKVDFFTAFAYVRRRI